MAKKIINPLYDTVAVPSIESLMMVIDPESPFSDNFDDTVEPLAPMAGGGGADLSNYYTKPEIDEIIDEVVAGTVDLTNYYQKNETYSRTEVDALIDGVEVDLSDYYTKTEVDGMIDETASQTDMDALQSALNTEISGRTAADATLQTNITNEATTRANADTALQTAINTKADTTALTAETTRATNAEAALQTAINNKQNTLTAGANITISGNTISATVPDLTDYYTKTEVDDLIDNVEVDLTNYYTKTQTDALLDDKADLTTITSMQTSISNLEDAQESMQTVVDGKISKTGDTMTGPLILAADPTTALGAATKGSVDAGLATKQNALTAGTKIIISGDTISADFSDYYNKAEVDAKVASGGTFDPTLYYNKTQTNALLDAKAEINAIHLVQDSGSSLHYTLVGENDVNLGEINIPESQILKSATYSADTKQIILVFTTESGDTTATIDVSDLVDTYTAGTGITIDSNNVISATVDLTPYYTSGQTDTLLAAKQNTLTAGDNIVISGNTISADLSGIDLTDYYTKEESDENFVAITSGTSKIYATDESGVTTTLNYSTGNSTNSVTLTDNFGMLPVFSAATGNNAVGFTQVEGMFDGYVPYESDDKSIAVLDGGSFKVTLGSDTKDVITIKAPTLNNLKDLNVGDDLSGMVIKFNNNGLPVEFNSDMGGGNVSFTTGEGAIIVNVATGTGTYIYGNGNPSTGWPTNIYSGGTWLVDEYTFPEGSIITNMIISASGPGTGGNLTTVEDIESYMTDGSWKFSMITIGYPEPNRLEIGNNEIPMKLLVPTGERILAKEADGTEHTIAYTDDITTAPNVVLDEETGIITAGGHVISMITDTEETWGNETTHTSIASIDRPEVIIPSSGVKTVITNTGMLAWANGNADFVDPSPTGWRLPTIAEIQALDAAGQGAWTTVNGVNGRYLGGGNNLFFSAGGDYNSGFVSAVGDMGFYWSSTPQDPTSGQHLLINTGAVVISAYSNNIYGCSVRCVREATATGFTPCPAGEYQVGDIVWAGSNLSNVGTFTNNATDYGAYFQWGQNVAIGGDGAPIGVRNKIAYLSDIPTPSSSIQKPQIFDYVDTNQFTLAKTPEFIIEVLTLSNTTFTYLQDNDADYTVTGNVITINNPTLTSGMKVKVVYSAI